MLVAVAVLGGCGGGDSGSSSAATTGLQAQTIPGPDGTPEHPSQVRCESDAKCRVTYPDGQVHDCVVSVEGDSSSISCTVDVAASRAGQARRWAGTWKSTFGRLTMRVQGGAVVGTYASCSGRLRGAPEGNRLRGEWTEDIRSCDTNRADDSTGTGTFLFTMGTDGKRFTGEWSYTDPDRNPPNVTWSGVRAAD